MLAWVAFVAVVAAIAVGLLYWASRQARAPSGVSDWTLLVMIPKFDDKVSMVTHLRAAGIRCTIRDARDLEFGATEMFYPDEPRFGLFVHARDVKSATEVLKSARLWPGGS